MCKRAFNWQIVLDNQEDAIPEDGNKSSGVLQKCKANKAVIGKDGVE